MYFIKNNYDITQNEPRIKVLFADDYLTTHPGDFWQDIKTTGLDNEGNVELKQSKKPEKLVYRIIKMATNEGDWVLDCFAGSGTTLSVAHKMRRKWIGIEIGKHAETKILPRLKNVLSNHDQSPIIKLTHWQGGGSFKYYHLGESIIKLKADGTGDFNWALGKEEIQESFLSSYDYVIDKTIDFQEEQLFQDKENQPLVGYQTVGTKKAVAVITLNEPSGYMEAISYEEIQQIYKKVKKEHNPEYTTIFTNRGVEIAYDSKPPDLEIVKIPHAIFAELER